MAAGTGPRPGAGGGAPLDPTSGPPVSPSWSQREQLTSYQFQRRRLVRSLVVADPETTVRPDKRLVISALVGALIGVLVLAVMAVIGILNPGNSTAWKDGGSVIVEKETGTRYILNGDGVLQPALNFTSAVLAVGGSDKVVTVSRGSLDGVPRGGQFGIPGAPDALPTDDDLIAGPWTACSQATQTGADARPVVSVDLGTTPAGEPLDPGRGIFVSTAVGGEQILLVDGRRHAVGSPEVIAALGWPNTSPLPVSDAWVDTVPAGGDLTFFSVPGEGEPGPEIAGQPTRLGEVFELSGPADTERFWVVTRAGLADVPPVGALLLMAGPDSPSDSATPITARDVAAAPRDEWPGPGAELPKGIPQPEPVPGDPAVAVCVTSPEPGDGSDDAPTMQIRFVDDPMNDGGPGVRTSPTAQEVAGADLVRVQPGTGALVSPFGDRGTGAAFLVTDQGLRYPLASVDTIPALGFGDKVRPSRIPPAMLALLPMGPTLDPGLVLDAPGPGGLVPPEREPAPGDDSGTTEARADGHFRPGAGGQ